MVRKPDQFQRPLKGRYTTPGPVKRKLFLKNQFALKSPGGPSKNNNNKKQSCSMISARTISSQWWTAGIRWLQHTFDPHQRLWAVMQYWIRCAINGHLMEFKAEQEAWCFVCCGLLLATVHAHVHLESSKSTDWRTLNYVYHSQTRNVNAGIKTNCIIPFVHAPRSHPISI